MGNMVGKIIDVLLEVFKKNYKRPRLWIGLGIIVFCLLLLFPYIDSNFFYFSRMEKRISILEKVMELDETRIYRNSAYANEYQSILLEIGQQRERSVNSVMNRVANYINHIIILGKEQGNGWIKFFSGAIWFLLVTVCVPFMNTFKKRSDKVLSFVLMLAISIVVGWFFSIIPIIITPAVNYIGIPVLQIVLVIIFVNRSNKKKKQVD